MARKFAQKGTEKLYLHVYFWLKRKPHLKKLWLCLATPLVCSDTKIGPIYEIHLEPGLAQKPHQLSPFVFSLLNQINQISSIGKKKNNLLQGLIWNAWIFPFIWFGVYHFKVCKTLLCISLLDFCLGNVKPSPNHKPYTLLHCLFYTESPTESKSSEERGRYRSCKTKGGTDLFTWVS